MKMLDWERNIHYKADHIGNRTMLVDGSQLISAKAQLSAAGYTFAAPDSGWSLTADDMLIKEGAPPLPPAARATHFGETIFIYPAGLVVTVALDGAFTIFLVP